VAADDQPWLQPIDGVTDGDAAQTPTARIDIDRALGRRVTDQHTALRAARQQLGRLSLIHNPAETVRFSKPVMSVMARLYGT
jgi:hypothetical protein